MDASTPENHVLQRVHRRKPVNYPSWSARHAILKTREELLRLYPNCFCGFGRPKRPLKIGIFEEIVARHPHINPYILSIALADYCRGPSYLSNMIEGSPRVDLDGKITGIVTAKEAKFSADKLDAA